MRSVDLIRVGHAHSIAGEGPHFSCSPGAGFAVWDGGFDAVVDFRAVGVATVAKFVAVLSFAAPAIFLGEAGFSEAHELIEDGEFELEFDGVDHRFDGGFADILVGEFEADEDDVHADADGVDGDELDHYFAGHGVVD